MLIQLTCHAPNAPDVGYLLGKNPASVFEREFSAGRVVVFYPEVAEDHVTVALLTEIDPIALVRGPSAVAGLDQYVHDRPYVASSLTSVALHTAFSSALAGKSRDRPERVGERMRWEARLPAVACDGGQKLIVTLFEPLGYHVEVMRLPLDQAFPDWGEAELYAVRLEGEQTTQDVLSHLYVLLPVLDNSKHYYVAAEEVEKLLDHGGAWLASHPARELIVRRYLRYKRPFVSSALARLDEGREAEADGAAERGAEGAGEADPREEPELHELRLHEPRLHELRLQAVIAAVREVGASSLADLGCGEGKLLRLAQQERDLTRILGMDVSTQALARAGRALHLETLSDTQRRRIQLVQGSLLYRDRRLEGFDVAALVEVVEHLDPPRLAVMERVVFEHARPRRVVMTTPNREYNARWAAVGTEKLRHSDHRFEWTCAECRAWAERVAEAYGYRAKWQELGPAEADLGAPSQRVIFDLDSPQPASHSWTESETLQ